MAVGIYKDIYKVQDVILAEILVMEAKIELRYSELCII